VRSPSLLTLVLLLSGCSAPKPPPPELPPPSASSGSKEDIAPEGATGFTDRDTVTSGHFMVATANPYATKAGLAMLERGGSAVDAAISAALVLTLVEPQSSGIGGGAFMLHHDAEHRRLRAYDGRETAPAAATPEMFMKGGKPKDFFDAVIGGLSVGVPGQLRMLELAHDREGKIAWKDLFTPAIELCEKGFELSPRLRALLARDTILPTLEPAASYFYRHGKPKPVGTMLKNPELAQVYRQVAERGANAFYEGPIADAIVAAARGHEKNPGRLSPDDMTAYEAKERDAICMDYRGHQVCGMPPPTSGGITTLQILGLLERFDLKAEEAGSPLEVHLFAEAGRLAYADRGRYLADPDFVTLPTGLLDDGYLAARSQLISPERAMTEAEPGEPPGLSGEQAAWADDDAIELPSTSHVVVVDGEGDVVSMTASIETAFGAHVMVKGFLLNNELTDFSFTPEQDGRKVANRVEPGKRPRSSMAPIIVRDGEGRFSLAVGSPGGSRIIPYVARTLIGILDHGLDPQAAIARPNFGNRGGPTEIERLPGQEAWVSATEAALKAKGHTVKIGDMNSGLQAIQRTDEGYRGGADPRREGLVMGE